MNSNHPYFFHHDCRHHDCTHGVSCFRFGTRSEVEFDELENIVAALDDDCTRVHLLVTLDGEDLLLLRHSHDDYSNHDIRIERVVGGVVVKILLRNLPGDDSHHGIRTEPVEVELDAGTLLSTDMVEVKVVLLPNADKVQVTVVCHCED